MSHAHEFPSNFNIAEHFIQGNIATGGRGHGPAFYHHERVFSYQEVSSYVRRTAAFFSDLGVQREQRIALLLDDSPELVWSFWGAIWAGCIPVPINVACPAGDICFIVNDCRARVLVTAQRHIRHVHDLASPYLRQVIVVDTQPSFLRMLDGASTELEAAETCRDEPAFWLYTSGSTGRPKGVVHAHFSMAVCAQAYAQRTLGLTSADISYSVAKIPFAYGLGNTLYMPMSVGAAAVLSESTNVFEIIKDVRRYRPTVFCAIPAVYSRLVELADISAFDTSSLRLCVSAAEQLPDSVWQRFYGRFGLKILEGIGTTEMLHIFLSNREDAYRPGSSGRPVEGYQVRVVGEGGEQLAPGDVGDLEVTGDSLMLGYWNRLQETRRAMFGSTIRTGDRYTVDADGFFRFVGRRDDLFKVQGLWVSPGEVEHVLRKHPAVLDCVVLPERGADRDLPYVAAYVVVKSGIDASGTVSNLLRSFARERLPHFKVPRRVRIVDEMPRTPTGKVDRRRLLQGHTEAAGALEDGI
jgi:benzoate-CoA ligase family protein